jgi:hypothetical protein
VSERVIMATMWCGPEVVGAVDEAPPSQADVDQTADELTAKDCAVKPTVRVVDQFTTLAYWDSGEPACEDSQGWPWCWTPARR